MLLFGLVTLSFSVATMVDGLCHLTMMSDCCLLTPPWPCSCVFYSPTTTWFLLTDRGRRLSVSSTKSQLSANFPWKPAPRGSDWTLQTILQASTSIQSQQKGSERCQTNLCDFTMKRGLSRKLLYTRSVPNVHGSYLLT